MLEKSDAARAVMGKEVLVYEDADGAVSIRTESGFELDARARGDRIPAA